MLNSFTIFSCWNKCCYFHFNFLILKIYISKLIINIKLTLILLPSLEPSLEFSLISRFKIDNFLPLASQLYFTPTEGKLLAFPGWVTHGVGQNISDEDRISFAFNINLFSNENPMNGQRSQNENPMNGQRSQNENVNTYAY